MSKGDEKGRSGGSLEIYLLGPFRVVVEGQAVSEREWSRRKPAQLIKLLALQPPFNWLEKAYNERHPDFIELNVEPALDNLHDDFRFADLLRRVGFG
jgi:hypothetical protein